ncbi:carboxypeptidase-like regulatory domain-containing protein [Flavobacterium sp.]|uniref:carboxypeptidase-like regulatory domain-containing protein n=1 Tax=Flavobacterium sp. TaxID=239 RepID=UPI00333E55CD
MKRFIIVFAINFLLINYTNSQHIVKGVVKDSANRPIVSATVCLYKINSDIILSYSITDDSGQYKILFSYPTNADSFYIQANALGYLSQKSFINGTNKNKDFVLSESNIRLPEVTVKNSNRSILKVNGDTISYSVDSLSSMQDRTIGDVLKKMPGIDVDESGKISYLGKPISNFYIDGDDLLNDRYNIATKAIPFGIVDKVQVIENHQPINILKNSIRTDKVALNLSLKDKAKIQLAYNLQFGIGLKNIFDNSLDIMSFKKKYKAINSIKSNNSGVDINDDVTSHNMNDILKQAENDIPQDLLSLSNTGTPSLPKQRYIFNNGKLFNSNNLYNLNNGIHFKANLYLISDEQNLDFENNISYFLRDTFVFKESQSTNKKHEVLNGNFTINVNNKKIYFNNSTKFEFKNISGESNSNVNGFGSKQLLNLNNRSFSNELNLIKTNNKRSIIEFYSYVFSLKKPESLSIIPGRNEDIFNFNIPYNSLNQKNNIPTFFTNNYISIKNNSNALFISYKAGFLYQHQSLLSNIYIEQLNNSISKASDSLNNDLQWEKYKIYCQADYDLRISKFQFGITLPVSWQANKYFDILGNKETALRKPFFTPTIKLRIQTGSESSVSWFYNYNATVANIESVYKGYIMLNFRLLNRSQIDFQQAFSHNLSLSYNYRKALKILFANCAISYSRNESNTISDTKFIENLNSKTLLAYNNQVDNMMISGGLSKYIFKIKTLVSLRSSFQINHSIQIQNNTLIDYRNTSFISTINFNSKIFSWLNLVYNYRQLNSSSINLSSKSVPYQNTSTSLHSLIINVNTSSNLYFTFREELNKVKYFGSSTINLFSDASVTYKVNKWKMDFSLSMLNITNENQYQIATISANNLALSQYAIRPRAIIAYFHFNF